MLLKMNSSVKLSVVLLLSILVLLSFSINAFAYNNVNNEGDKNHIYKHIRGRQFPSRELLDEKTEAVVEKNKDCEFILETKFIQKVLYKEPQYSFIKYEDDEGNVIHEEIESSPLIYRDYLINERKRTLKSKVKINEKEYNLIFAYVQKTENNKLEVVKIYQNKYDVIIKDELIY